MAYVAYVAFVAAELWHIPHKVIFGRFLYLTNTWALMTRRRLQNQLKITLYGICHSSAPINATPVPKVPLYKLDGVGPVDNRPSTNKLHPIVQKKEKKKKKK